MKLPSCGVFGFVESQPPKSASPARTNRRRILSRVHLSDTRILFANTISPIGLLVGRTNLARPLFWLYREASPWLVAAKAACAAIFTHRNSIIAVTYPWLENAKAAGAPFFAHCHLISTAGDILIVALMMFILTQGSQMLADPDSLYWALSKPAKKIA